jgi:eukaryotic-like serine/threonine-protein kinase
VVERVVQLASNRLLWVQVRSADRATANVVLDDVDTRGI